MHKNIGSTKSNRCNPSKINVLEIIGNADRGGMENYIKNFIEFLPNEFRLTYICPYESEFTSFLKKVGPGRVYISAIEDDPLWNSIQMAVQLIKLHEIDIIHAHMPKAHALAVIAGALTKVPVVATVHGMEITSHELGITKTGGSHLITNNQQAYLQALALGVSPSKVDLIRNGVDVSVFNPEKAGKAFRTSLNIPENIPLVGFMGRLEYEKGPDLFLKAAEYIHYQMPGAHFVLVGDGSMKDQLKLLCKRMNLDQHLHFIDWQINNAKVYPGIDVLAHTSRSDGTSLVLLEAMACECATVAIGIGGVLEIVENRCSGLLVSNWEDVALKILELLKQPEIIKQMGIAGRMRVEQLFNASSNTHRVAEILKNTISPGTLKVNSVGNFDGINETLIKEEISIDSLQQNYNSSSNSVANCSEF